MQVRPRHGLLASRVLAVHRYTGFLFAAYLIVVCLSGSALIVLENRIDGFRDYPMERVPVGPRLVTFSQIIRSVERANPGRRVYHVLESCASGCTYDASMHAGDGRLDALVDPYTGRIVRTVLWNRTPVGLLDNLHGSLFAGGTGSAINGGAAVSLVVLGVTGLFLWPGWRRRPRWTNYDVHRVTGIAAVGFLLVLAITGATQVFWPDVGDAEQSSRAGTHEPLDFDTLVRIGSAALPGQLTMVYPAQSGIVTVRKRLAGDPDPYGYSYVAVDAYSGRILHVSDVRSFSPLDRVRAAVYAVHVGAIGGPLLRWIYAAAGVAPALLFTTGFLMWLRRVRRASR